MDWRQYVREHLPAPGLGGAREAEIVEELALQLESCYAEARREGATDEEAVARAQAQFPRWAELAREIRVARRPLAGRLPEPLRREDPPHWIRHGRGRPMGDLLQDVRYAFRTLGKNAGFTSTVVLTLALGIGANTAIFSVLHAVVLRPLPYPEPERIVMVWQTEKGEHPGNMGFPTFADWRAQSRSFDAMAALSGWSPTLTPPGSDPEALEGASVSADFFRVLGVAPMLGRDFTADDDKPNVPRIAIISHGLWQRLGGDPSLVGKPVLMGDIERTIVGVMPPNFQSLLTHEKKNVDAWRPLGYAGEQPPACRTCQHLRAVGRLRRGVTREEATAELQAITQRMERDHPTDYSGAGAALQPLHELFAGDARQALLVLFGAVGFVLLVACGNVAALQLSRAAARQREVAVRTALGAGRGRIVRQFLTESLLLSLTGGALGILGAQFLTQWLVTLAPANLPRLELVRLDLPVLGFALTATLVAGLLFGIGPALAAARANLNDVLKEGGRTAAGPGRGRLRNALVVMEVALALVLLAGAGLTLKSLSRLLNVNPGFQSESVLTMDLFLFGPPFMGDAGLEKARATYDQLMERIHALPGVKAAGGVSQLPLGGNSDRFGVRFRDKPIANPADAPSAYRYAVTPRYLETMRIPLRRGRGITSADRAGSRQVALINEEFAARIWSGEDPIGKFVQMGGPDGFWWEIVGVIGNVQQMGLDQPLQLQIYVPEAQWQWADDLTLAVRTEGDPMAHAAAVRQAVQSVSGNIRVTRVAPMETVIGATVGERRFTMLLLAMFAAAGLALAAIGLYGVMAHAVTQRTNEIGLRLALGALPGDVLRLVLRQGMALAVAGLALGLAGAIALGRFVAQLLYEVQPYDPVTLATVAAVLAVVALFACYLPARRAAHVDPLVALRYE